MHNYFRNEIIEGDFSHADLQEGTPLNRNECPFDIPLDIKVRITERLLRSDWNRYPAQDIITLQKKLALKSGLQPDQFIVANGTDSLVQSLINIINPHHKVLTLDPSLSVYETQARLHGNKVIKVPLSEDFELQTEKTLTTIKKEKPGLIFIANPHTPTGSLFDKKSLYSIIQTARCPVVIDEAYYPLTEETALSWLDDFENLIIMRSFSRAFALAGVRFGFMVAHVDITSQIEKFLLPYRISIITSTIVEEILNHPDYVKENIKAILSERARLFSNMQKINDLTVYPSEANFLLFKVTNARDIAKKLKDEKILVKNVSDDTTVKNCLRVTVGSPEENDLFLTVIRKILVTQ
ncbi:MAG: histidinol-phosphate transaminase [Deltaproteobacteria bacterium]|nr:histidinol-phosphate transaminase [Deltaproteobacteria bacterium]